MVKNLAGNRKSIALDENDVALIFKEDGHVDLSFPEVVNNHVPEHVMAALALSYAVVDEEFFDLIQERFSQQAAMALEDEAQRKTEKTEQEQEENRTSSSHLKVVS